MNDEISQAISNSINFDRIEHIDIEAADIFEAMEGLPYDDAVQLEHGEWDVWGSDEDAGGEYRLHIYLSSGYDIPTAPATGQGE